MVVGASRGLSRGIEVEVAERRGRLRPRHLLDRHGPEVLIIVVSSGAAVNGSPLRGGYAGAKATQRFVTAYAQDESRRAGLDLTFTAVLPQLTPATGARPTG